jgi:hypothetical protein
MLDYVIKAMEDESKSTKISDQIECPSLSTKIARISSNDFRIDNSTLPSVSEDEQTSNRMFRKSRSERFYKSKICYSDVFIASALSGYSK